ncbi:MAG: AMP-binding protein [Acidimicrobiales bacterium]|nr:AMP-binding protein [Acidimicrobiales bacterium]
MRWLSRFDLATGRSMTLGNLMERVAQAHPKRTLVHEVASGRTLTTNEAAQLVDRWALVISQRSELGDRVVIATVNGYDQLLLTLAASRAGRIPAPVNSQMTEAEVDHVVTDSGASLVIRSVEDLGSTDEIASDDDSDTQPGVFGKAVEADPRSVAALFYTSGTTGAPKGAELTHNGLIGGLSIAALAPTELRDDEIVMALPLAHIFGFAIAIGAACAGIPVCFLDRFNPVAVMETISLRRSSIFSGVPAMYRMMEQAGAEDFDLTCVRCWISGADAMPADLAHRFKKRGATFTLPILGSMGEAMFAEGYGMVETAGGVAIRISPPLVPAALGGSVGMPLPGVSFRVLDEDGSEVPIGGVGELVVKGPGVLTGYHGAPEATAATITEDGWLRTGDFARRGPFGIVNFEGRMKDVIKRGGYSVYAVEVEQDLEEHPAVAEAAVVALPHDRDGEVPVAAIRLADGAAFDETELVAWSTERMSRYKVPAHFVVVEDFPRTGTDKIQRRQVAAQMEALLLG